MAYQIITNPEIATGAPIDTTLLGKVKTNLDDHEGRVLTIDGSVNSHATTLSNLSTSLGDLSTTVTAIQELNAATSPAVLTSLTNSIAISLATKVNFTHTMTENTTLANPTNAVAGQSGQILLTQHATVAKTLSFGSNWLSTDGFIPSLSTTLGAKNLLTYYVASPTEIWFVLLKRGIV